jgi:hypothetical protein
MKGHLYKRDLMVVGRAVNGWADGILAAKLAQPASAVAYAQKVFDSVTGNDGCPMKWVTDNWGTQKGYNTKRSAFWRVIREVVNRYSIANVDTDPWSSYLVWSNLYKVSPCEGGNPSGNLREIQLSGCISLLKLETSYYLPHNLLLLTGWGWAEPFLQQIATDCRPISGCSHIEAIGQIVNNSAVTTKIVVAAHPQGRQEGPWVKEVVQAMR